MLRKVSSKRWIISAVCVAKTAIRNAPQGPSPL